jgi:hypothetical protein
LHHVGERAATGQPRTNREGRAVNGRDGRQASRSRIAPVLRGCADAFGCEALGLNTSHQSRTVDSGKVTEDRRW